MSMKLFLEWSRRFALKERYGDSLKGFVRKLKYRFVGDSERSGIGARLRRFAGTSAVVTIETPPPPREDGLEVTTEMHDEERCKPGKALIGLSFDLFPVDETL